MGQIQQAAGGLAQTALGAAVAGKHLKQQQQQIDETKELKQQQLEAEAVELPVKIAEAAEKEAVLKSAKAHEDYESKQKEADKAVEEFNARQQAINKQHARSEELLKAVYGETMPSDEAQFMIEDAPEFFATSYKGLKMAGERANDAIKTKQEAAQKAKLTDEQAAARARKTRDAKITAYKKNAQLGRKRLKYINEQLGGKK